MSGVLLPSIMSGSWTVYVLMTAMVAAVIAAAVKRFNYVQRVNKVPGAFGGLTFLGNAIDVSNIFKCFLLHLITNVFFSSKMAR